MKRIGIIAGATGGVGSTLANNLAKTGDTLVLIGKDYSKLKELKNKIQTHSINCDIVLKVIDFERNKEDKVKSLFSEIYKEYGKINYLINCVGFCM